MNIVKALLVHKIITAYKIRNIIYQTNILLHSKPE